MTDQRVNFIYQQLGLLVARMGDTRPIWVDATLGFVMAIIGAFLSAIFALWYQGRNGPRFIISVGTTSDDYRGNSRRHVRFTRITVINSPRHYKLVPRRTAYACHGYVDFLNMEGRQIVPRMPIRWDGAPEPLKRVPSDGGSGILYDPTLLRFGGYIDIAPDRSATSSPALRLEKPNAAFGWTTESYAYEWEHPAYAIPFGQYRIRLTVQTENHSIPKEFLLTNPKEFDGFDLTEM